MANEPKRLYRSSTDRKIWGVCGGLGEFFSIDPVWFRVLFVILVFVGGSGIILYIVLALITTSPPRGAIPDHQEIPNDTGTSTTQDASHRYGGTSGAVAAGLVFIGVGLFLLLANLNVFTWLRLGVIVPVVLILLGILLFLNRRR